MTSRADRFAMARRALLVLVVLFCALSPAIPAEPDVPVVTIILHGSSHVTHTMSALKSMPAVSVRVRDELGSHAEYTGVPLSELLAASSVEFGKAVRGERLAEFVLISAADGYRVLFSIAEVDPAFRSRTILLCYGKGGSALPEKEGPLRLVVADEDRHARWVRQVTTIEVDIQP